MAFVKITKDGIVIRIEDSEIKKCPLQSVQFRQAFDQLIEIDNIPGTRVISYPISFPNKLNRVFVIGPDGLKDRISICNANLDSFTISIPPNEFDVKEKISLSATGY